MSIIGTYTVQLLRDKIPPHKLCLYMEGEELKGTYENDHGIQQIKDIHVTPNGKEFSFTCLNGKYNDEEFRFTLNWDGTNLVGGALNLTNAELGNCPTGGKRLD